MTEQQFKDILRQRMHEKEINQSRLSELSKVSTGLISGWFTGKHDITFRKVLKICEVLDVVSFEGVEN